MTHKKNLLAALFLLGMAISAHAQSRCAASPEPLEVKQPDGTVLTVIGQGNSLINYAETVDGYSVVRNKSGVYEYARPALDGGFIPSGIKAHNPTARNNSEKTYLSAQTF